MLLNNVFLLYLESKKVRLYDIPHLLVQNILVWADMILQGFIEKSFKNIFFQSFYLSALTNFFPAEC